MKLLVRAVDAPLPDAGCHKKGEVIVVADDVHTWGRKEGPPGFVTLSLPYASSVGNNLHLLNDGGEDLPHRKRFFLAAEFVDALLERGGREVTVSPAELTRHLIDRLPNG